MPEIGDKKRALELGKKGRSTFVWAVCSECGKARWTRLIYRNNICRACSAIKVGRGQRGNKHPRWNGGKTNSNGYIDIKLQPEDFFFPMAGKNHYVREHRLVMARHMKRCLLPWEIVHHRNGIKNDNRLENLTLIKGQAGHLDSCRMQKEIKDLREQVIALQKRVMLLESENILLKHQETLDVIEN